MPATAKSASASLKTCRPPCLAKLERKEAGASLLDTKRNEDGVAGKATSAALLPLLLLCLRAATGWKEQRFQGSKQGCRYAATYCHNHQLSSRQTKRSGASFSREMAISGQPIAQPAGEKCHRKPLATSLHPRTYNLDRMGAAPRCRSFAAAVDLPAGEGRS